MTKLEKYKAMLMEAILVFEEAPVPRDQYAYGIYESSLKWLRRSLASVESSQFTADGKIFLQDLSRLQIEAGLEYEPYCRVYGNALRYCLAEFIKDGQFSRKALVEPA